MKGKRTEVSYFDVGRVTTFSRRNSVTHFRREGSWEKHNVRKTMCNETSMTERFRTIPSLGNKYCYKSRRKI
jgi:hypothetical protein